MWRVADDIEAIQLGMGSDLIDHAQALLDDPNAEAGELRFLSKALVSALGDALRIAESRGGRLQVPDSDGSAGGERSSPEQRLARERSD